MANPAASHFHLLVLIYHHLFVKKLDLSLVRLSSLGQVIVQHLTFGLLSPKRYPQLPNVYHVDIRLIHGVLSKHLLSLLTWRPHHTLLAAGSCLLLLARRLLLLLLLDFFL